MLGGGVDGGEPVQPVPRRADRQHRLPLRARQQLDAVVNRVEAVPVLGGEEHVLARVVVAVGAGPHPVRHGLHFYFFCKSTHK